MTMDSNAKVLLADAIGIPLDDLPAEARIGEVAGWDSLAHTRLLLSIEERLRRELEPEEAVAIESLRDVEALLSTGDGDRRDA
jgi:acyl carrier protein